jgi:periplasmic divalent cation tolerance protein
MIYVTASSREEAESIGKRLVSMRLAACANVFDEVNFFYRWEGKEESTGGAVLILKTREDLFGKVEEEVKKLHSYSCPCILAIPVIRANGEYTDWIMRETG